jgi:mRNA-degrading endonuclease RelE of RelBE toxin-antitoxin system
MVKTIELSKQAKKSLRKMSAPDRARAEQILDELARGDVVGEKLQKDHLTRKARFGKHRILYQECDGVVVIEYIGPRGDAYKHAGF